MKTPSAPSFSYFNKRDLSTLLNVTAPLFFIVLIGLYFHEFVWHAISVNIAINLGIISAAAFGVVLILARLVSAQEDFRIIQRFGYEAQQGVYMKTLLDQPWLKNRYVRHYLSHIANTGGTLATQLEHSAIESELHALQADYESRLELPQFLVGFMIAMGLLGTFIGLLETLTGISGMLDGMSGSGEDVQKQFMKLVVELRKPLAGMGIAFSASMFGLITSLMLAIMMTNLRRFISRTISLARNVMHDLTEMARETRGGTGGSLSPADIASLLSENEASTAALPAPAQSFGQNYSVGGSSDIFVGSGSANAGLVGRMDVLTKKLEMLLDAFQTQTESTKKLNDLLGFGPRMKEISEKTLEELKGISAKTFDLLDFHKQADGRLAEQLHYLAEQLLDAREIGIGNGRHLNEIKENFIKICQTSGVVDLIASGVGGHTALLEALIEETRRSQQGLAIINRSILDKQSNP